MLKSSKRISNVMPKIAAIDVGSNAMRLLISEVSRNGTTKTIFSKREPVRLGADVFATGTITPEILERSIEAFKGFRDICDNYQVLLIRAVGTSALREAKNSFAFVEDIFAETGIRIEIIPGTEEARLIQLAVARTIDFRRKFAVVIDMGGGSTEVSLVLNGNIIVSETHKIGAVRLLHLLEVKKYPFKVFSRLVSEYVKGLRRELKREIGDRHVDLCVGTGGNFETLGGLRVKLLGKKEKDRLTLSDLELIMERINSLSVEDRITRLGLRPDRADVIGPAAAVLAEIMREAQVREVRLPAVGLKDGMIVDLIPHLQGGKAEIQRRQLLAFAQEMGRKYQTDMRHVESVRERAIFLFDRMLQIHRLGREARLLLEVAALLHDIGHFISSDEHHKHSMYLIRATPIIGLDKRSQDIISCIARYHRKSLPREDHEVYRDFSKIDRLIVKKLSALLRVADATDRGQGRVRDVALRFQASRCIITIQGSGEMLLEQWAIKKKADLFELQFHKKVEIVVKQPVRGRSGTKRKVRTAQKRPRLLSKSGRIRMTR
jgi:exopolyphosphatase/guanosine-5'-triphosphate,3'-diphosphate pyrophosphatase